jgi:hypothetical protein
MVKAPIRIRDLRQALPFTGAGIDLPLGDLEQAVASFDFDVCPPYQRDHVWTQRQRELFVGHVLVGGKVPALIAVQPEELSERHQIVDGKQRLTSVLRWKRNEFAADIDGRLIFYDDTDKHFSLSHTLRADFVRVRCESELLLLYLRLNSGGTPHAAEHLAAVRQMYLAALEREKAEASSAPKRGRGARRR